MLSHSYFNHSQSALMEWIEIIFSTINNLNCALYLTQNSTRENCDCIIQCNIIWTTFDTTYDIFSIKYCQLINETWLVSQQTNTSKIWRFSVPIVIYSLSYIDYIGQYIDLSTEMASHNPTFYWMSSRHYCTNHASYSLQAEKKSLYFSQIKNQAHYQCLLLRLFIK